jgi:hypothetical protein
VLENVNPVSGAVSDRQAVTKEKSSLSPSQKAAAFPSTRAIYFVWEAKT